MAALTAVAIGAAAIGGGLALKGSADEAKALRKQGDYQKDMYDFNSNIAKLQGEDAIKRGEREAIRYEKKGQQAIGASRAALAAQGVDVSSGSALDVQTDIAEQAAVGAVTIRNNAWREAWGYKVQAESYSKQGYMAREAAQSQARQTMLTGVANTIGLAGKMAGGAK